MGHGKVHKMTQRSSGKRLQKKLTRVERLEKAVKQLSGMPQFLLQKFQDIVKVVEDVRFTYEVLGQILQEKGIITQEEVTEKGKILIEERKKARDEQIKKLKDKEEAKEKLENSNVEVEEVKKELAPADVDELRSEVAKDLMQPREDLKEKQTQDKDVSIKEID
jgi:hypothetical protein